MHRPHDVAYGVKMGQIEECVGPLPGCLYVLDGSVEGVAQCPITQTLCVTARKPGEDAIGVPLGMNRGRATGDVPDPRWLGEDV